MKTKSTLVMIINLYCLSRQFIITRVLTLCLNLLCFIMLVALKELSKNYIYLYITSIKLTEHPVKYIFYLNI